MTWPRVRLVFAIIGMIATASFLGVQILEGVAWIVEMLEQGKEMLP